jgi:hypothetical protein
MRKPSGGSQPPRSRYLLVSFRGKLCRRSEPLLENGGSDDPIQFVTKLLNSFDATMALAEFGGR